MKQSHTIVAKEAFDAVMHTMKVNDNAKGDAWLHQEVDTHLAHARQHLHMLNRGDNSEDHIRHAITRIAMALAITRCDKLVLAELKNAPKKWSITDVEAQP